MFQCSPERRSRVDGVESIKALFVEHIEVAPQFRNGALGCPREVVAEDAALNVVIEQSRNNRVFTARYDDDIVDELIIVAPHADEPLAEFVFFLRGDIVDDENLEIGSVLCLGGLVVGSSRSGTLRLFEITYDLVDRPAAICTALEQSSDIRGSTR
jgi:hypothetical protein